MRNIDLRWSEKRRSSNDLTHIKTKILKLYLTSSVLVQTCVKMIKCKGQNSTGIKHATKIEKEKLHDKISCSWCTVGMTNSTLSWLLNSPCYKLNLAGKTQWHSVQHYL